MVKERGGMITKPVIFDSVHNEIGFLRTCLAKLTFANQQKAFNRTEIITQVKQISIDYRKQNSNPSFFKCLFIVLLS